MENERKLELLEQIHYWVGIVNRRVQWTSKEIKVMYDIYNEYFNPVKPETNTGCPSCVSKVSNAFRLVDKDYEKIKEELMPKENMFNPLQNGEPNAEIKDGKLKKSKPNGWNLRKCFIDDDGVEWCYGKKVK